MGLLSTEVEVRLTGSNIKYYEDLGYEIPRYFNKNKWKWLWNGYCPTHRKRVKNSHLMMKN